MEKECRYPQCPKPAKAKGLCTGHYARQRLGQSVETPLKKHCQTEDEREQFYVDKSAGPDGCWPWLGALNKGGYAIVSISRRTLLAHRWMYFRHKGPIPRGKTIDHLCNVRSCVNPRHLEAVWLGVNIDRIAARSAFTRT